MMRLRAAACFAVLALLVAPLAGLAQMAGKIPRIGIVFPGTPGPSSNVGQAGAVSMSSAS